MGAPRGTAVTLRMCSSKNAGIKTRTRQGQMDLLDGLVQRWADSSTMKSLKAQADAMPASGPKLSYSLAGLTADTPAYEQFISKLGVVERFMGFTCAGVNGQARTSVLSATEASLSVTLVAEQVTAIARTYELIKKDVFESLLLVTRAQVYMDLLDIKFSGEQVALDWQAVENAFAQAIAVNAKNGLTDLADFMSVVSNSGNEWFKSFDGNDVLEGKGCDDTLTGGAGAGPHLRQKLACRQAPASRPSPPCPAPLLFVEVIRRVRRCIGCRRCSRRVTSRRIGLARCGHFGGGRRRRLLDLNLDLAGIPRHGFVEHARDDLGKEDQHAHQQHLQPHPGDGAQVNV